MNKPEKEKAILKKADLEGRTTAYQKCLLRFFDYPETEISLNDLSADIGISKTTARKIVLQLETEGFLIRKEIGKVWRISCNKEHYYNHTVKIAYHLDMIYRTNLLEETYKKFPNSRAVVLFGSYRKGDDNEKSDIDIAVEVLDKQKMSIHELGVIPRLGFRKNVKVNLHVFSRDRIDLNLFANIANGIALGGFLEVSP